MHYRTFLFSVVVFSLNLNAVDWKTAGEYFENEGNLGIAKQIYEYEAQRGDLQAQTRLDVFGKKNVFNPVDKIRCQTAIDSRDFSDVEKYAILGQSECMFALAIGLNTNSIRATYWLSRTILNTKSSRIKSGALYELAKLKDAVMLMEQAARLGSVDAQNWLEDQKDPLAVLAHASYLRSLGRESFAHFRTQSVQGNYTYKDLLISREEKAVDICTGIKSALTGLKSVPLALLEQIDSCIDDIDLMNSLRAAVINSDEYQQFSAKLKRLEFLMHLEDLYSMLGLRSERSASLLKESQEIGDSAFGKVVSELRRFKQAVANYEQRQFFFWDLSLKSTLSIERMSNIKSTFAMMLHQFTDLIYQFRHSESTQQLYQNGIAQRQEQLEQLATDYLATQKAHDTQLRYELNEKSEGLSVFQYVSEAVQVLMVSPNTEPKAQILEGNEMLVVKVSGEWSPICAISSSGKVSEPTTLRVGPEGYRVHVTKGQLESSGHDERESQSEYSQTSHASTQAVDWLKAVGVGLGAVVGTILLPGAGTVIGMGIGATATSPFSVSESSHSTKGASSSSDTAQFRHRSSSQSQTALFQSGLRLEQTPYPRMPAGAYLAVVFSKETDTLGQIIDTFVLSSPFTYVASQKVEIFFVVNDCVDSRSSGVLSVQIQKHRPANAEVNKLMTTMLKSLQVFSEKGEALVSEGGDLSSRIETLKAEVVAKLEQNSVTDFMADPTLRSVFMHWIQQEADKVVRKARMLELSRQMRTIHSDVNGMDRLLKLEQTKVDQSVQESQSEVVQYASEYVLPILQLYGSKQEGNWLVQDELSEVKQVSEYLLKAFDVDDLVEDFVVIRVPKPGKFLSVAERRKMPTLDDKRAKQLWDNLFTNTSDTGIQIRFSDVYQDVVQGGLLLNQDLPVMVDMNLILGHDSVVEAEFLRTQLAHASVAMTVGSEQAFSDKTYRITHDDIRWHKIPIGFVNSDEFPTASIFRNSRTATGLSPFTTYSFGKIKNTPQEHLQDVFLVMKILYRRKLR